MAIKIKQYRPIGDEEIISLSDIHNLTGEQLSKLIEGGYARIDKAKVHLMTGGHILEAYFVKDSNSSKMISTSVHFISRFVNDINLIDFYPNGKALDIECNNVLLEEL